MKARNLLIPSAMICASLLGSAWQSEAQTYSTPANTFQRVGKITGSTVLDTSGQAVGKIQDLITDTRNGAIDFAIISLNQNPGQFTAVPWPALRQTGPSTFTLNTAPDALRTASTFPADRYPDFSQPGYDQQLYSHYGLTWPAGTARGGYLPVETGVEQGGVYYDNREYYETEPTPWYRPQPDGHDIFPALHGHPGEP